LTERSVGWVKKEVEAYMAERLAERNAPSAKTTRSKPLYMRMGEVMKHTGFDHGTIYVLIRKTNLPKLADMPKRGSGWYREEVRCACAL
jgi:predicted DNA-binding transcriptional regulator AlpA